MSRSRFLLLFAACVLAGILAGLATGTAVVLYAPASLSIDTDTEQPARVMWRV